MLFIKWKIEVNKSGNQEMCPRVFTKLSAGPRDGSEIKMLATQMQTPEFRSLAYVTARWSGQPAFNSGHQKWRQGSLGGKLARLTNHMGEL